MEPQLEKVVETEDRSSDLIRYSLGPLTGDDVVGLASSTPRFTIGGLSDNSIDTQAAKRSFIEYRDYHIAQGVVFTLKEQKQFELIEARLEPCTYYVLDVHGKENEGDSFIRSTYSLFDDDSLLLRSESIVPGDPPSWYVETNMKELVLDNLEPRFGGLRLGRRVTRIFAVHYGISVED